MPSYTHKKTKIFLCAESEEQYDSYKELFVPYTEGLHSEGHRLYTIDLLAKVAENKPEDDEDEKLAMARMDSFGGYLYGNIEYDDESMDIIFVFNEYFPTEEIYEQGLAWRESKNIFANDISAGPKPPVITVTHNVQFHKPYKT